MTGYEHLHKIGDCFNRRRFLAGSVALVAAAATPILAQQFFDVPFVPTPQIVVDEMLRLAKVGPNDVVYDLGSGDGRIVITAARKFGARGVGVELNEHLIYQSEESALQAKVSDRVKFLQQDFFKTDFSEASVVTLYLLPGVMKRLRERMLLLKPGTRLVAHDFDFDDWRPDVKTTIRKNVFLWIVPAKVGGRWQMRVELPEGPFGFEMDVRQKYQEIDGVVRIEGLPGGIWEAKLEADRIRFVVVDSRDRDHEASLYFEGTAAGNTMQGEGIRGVGNQAIRFKWRATRQG
ncbi:MAG: SAM-dependent methyltransferase [Burkholderiales bacterium]